MIDPVQSVRLVYCGCGLAGKTSSLLSALTRCRQTLPKPLSHITLGEHRFDIERRAGGRVDLSVRISARRAQRRYDPLDQAGDPILIEEIDAISRADALVFVIDSQLSRSDANIEAFSNLVRDIRTRGTHPEDIPVVFQANKRDMADIVTMEWVRLHFRTEHCSYVESVALQQLGTLEAMREAIGLAARRLPYR